MDEVFYSNSVRLFARASDTARVRMNPSLGEFVRDNAVPVLAALQEKEWT